MFALSHRVLGGRAMLMIGLLLLLMTASGCTLLSRKTVSPETQLRSMRQEQQGTPEGVIPTDLQAEVMRYADRFGTMVVQSMDTIIPRLGSPETRARAQAFKVNQASAAVFIAAGPEALATLLDMVVLVSLGRQYVGQTWGDMEGEQAQALLETYRQFEEEIWALAARHLRPPQVRELRELLAEWHPQLSKTEAVSFLRFGDLAATFNPEPARNPPPPNSVLSLPRLDLLAGLNAASRTVEQTRFLAERTLYYVQRLPLVAQWRTELLASMLALAPELRQAFSLSTMLSNTTAQLPILMSRQREAAIDRVFAELARQQTNLLVQLAAQEQQFSGVVTNFRALLVSGTDAAAAANDLVDSTRAMFGELPTKELGMALTNARPFDIREYAGAIAQLTASARELNQLMQSTDRTLPRVMQQGVSSGEQFANHLFKLGVLFGCLFLVGLVMALLTYRFLVAKFIRPA